MTTSWAHLVRGHLGGAVRSNLGGTLLGVLVMAVVLWLFGSAIRGRWLGLRPAVIPWTWLAVAWVMVTMLDWGVRLLFR